MNDINYTNRICDLIILGAHSQPELLFLNEILQEIKRKHDHSAKFEFIIEFETQLNDIYKNLTNDNKNFLDYQGVLPLIYSRDKQTILGSFNDFIKYLTVNFSYSIVYDNEKYEKLAVIYYENYLKNHKNKFVFLKLNTSVKPIVIELFNEICPKTTRNFLELCKGQMRNKRGDSLNYQGCEIFRVVKNCFIQSGDFKDHTDSKSIYGKEFEDENYILNHDSPGVVGMVKNNGKPHSNESQFYITLNTLKSFNGKFTAFGRVVSGLDILLKLNEVEVYMQRPTKRVEIEKCGEYNG